MLYKVMLRLHPSFSLNGNISLQGRKKKKKEESYPGCRNLTPCSQVQRGECKVAQDGFANLRLLVVEQKKCLEKTKIWGMWWSPPPDAPFLPRGGQSRRVLTCCIYCLQVSQAAFTARSSRTLHLLLALQQRVLPLRASLGGKKSLQTQLPPSGAQPQGRKVQETQH